MKEKKCKKCKRELQQGYKYSICENCMNKNVQLAKKYVKNIASVLVVAVPAAFAISKKMKY